MGYGQEKGKSEKTMVFSGDGCGQAAVDPDWDFVDRYGNLLPNQIPSALSPGDRSSDAGSDCAGDSPLFGILPVENHSDFWQTGGIYLL
jgi:hypothetical protein